MKNNILLIFLFVYFHCGAQTLIPNSSFKGSYDSLQYEKGASDQINELKEKSKPLFFSIDSMEGVIKNLDDKGLKKRLEQLMILVKNDSLGDVYDQMQKFGTGTAVEINKKVAPPKLFYRLDREHYQYITRLKELENKKLFTGYENNSAKTLDAIDCQMLERFPYDSLYKTMSTPGPGDESEKREQFLTTIGTLYSQPVTEEDVNCAIYKSHRIIVCGEKTEVFIRKEWNWGGVFCFYNGNIPIKETDYYELSKLSMQKAISYRQNKLKEK